MCTESDTVRRKEQKRKKEVQETKREGPIRCRERNDKQTTDRWSLPLQGHKSRREKEGKDNRRKMRGGRGKGNSTCVRERERERTERA